MVQIAQVLVSPIVTEKTVAMTGKYTFKVNKEATKADVIKAVNQFYGKGLTIEKVNIINLPQKTKVIAKGKLARRRAPFKKAVVTLKEGQTLNFNDFK